MRVHVADDHPLFRDGIIGLLQAADFDVIGQVGDGQAAVEAALRLRPDIVLMDITMPQMSGLEALRLIKKALPETQVVMLTVSDDDSDLVEAIRSGAQGYLLKSLGTDEFIEMLNGLQQGEAAMTRQTTARLMKGFTESTLRQAEPTDRLTEREIELLELVALGLANKAIAQDKHCQVPYKKYLAKTGGTKPNRGRYLCYPERVDRPSLLHLIPLLF
jgi:two-component system NarL family response regulator